MYRLGLRLGLGFVWGLRLHISLIYEFIYISALNIIYIYSSKPETVHRYSPVSEIYRTAGQTGTASGTVLTPLGPAASQSQKIRIIYIYMSLYPNTISECMMQI